MANELKKDLGIYCKIVCASATNDDGNKPENVIDGDYKTRWSSDVPGAELTLELDRVYPVAYIGVSCFNGDERKTKIGVSVSEDGESYTRVIDNVMTEKKSAMVPVSLGATYNAKFVKIHGYGNTQNAWTSIAEVRVYSPSPDGVMHVDPNGPKKKTLEDLPPEVQRALNSVEKYYVGVIPWLANMYDPKTHGFYMTKSGMQDPEMEPAIEMTCWGVSYLSNYTEAFATMPEDFRQNLIKFFQDRQDPKTGMFIDKQGPANPRETARNQDSALGALKTLGGQKLHPHPREVHSVDAVKEAALMPDYMESVDTYINWIASMDWENGSWHCGDQTQSSQKYVAMLPDGVREQYIDAAVKWLNERQQESGLWSTKYDFCAASGAFKVGLVYSAWGLRLPNYDKIIDAIFECYKRSKTNNPFFVRNPISVLAQMSGYSPEAKAKIQRLLIENIDAVVANFGEFLCPDGAFSASKGKSMHSFGGVVGSHQLFEGDIDATLMILIARKQLYGLFDIPAPPLDATDFWDWIYGKKTMPDPYAAVKDMFE
ncbi:MAG: discoidin domain-containing protein [Clostridia bacterium]|nr:discoidin domain-containing protein [Clostridia bacterium]